MPRCSKRQRSAALTTPELTSITPNTSLLMDEPDSRHQLKRSRNSSTRHSRGDDISFCPKRCLTWFKEYTTPHEPDLLGPDGMERFCEDINVEPENIVMLVIAYKMGAKQMGYFTQEEWLRGLTEMQCDCASKLQSKLDYLHSTLNDPQQFKVIYRYSYDFARDKDQRSLDTTTARALLGVLLSSWSLRPALDAYLQTSRHRVINRDQWINILELSRTVSHDLHDYDVDGAWPVMLDEFVEWLRQQRKEANDNSMQISNS